MSKEQKPKIIIVDDEEMNRSLLIDMLSDEYDLIEAVDGKTCIRLIQQRKNSTEITLVLLDNIMPEMRGLDVMEVMYANHWTDDFPVIMISADQSPEYIERAYELGVTEFISRPFNALVVRKRVINTILLFGKQKRLVGMVAEQIYEKEQRSSLMIDILSHIVEFRNGESGLHVLHVRTLTELLLNHLAQKTTRYGLSSADISMISTASALHDIGKIAIDESILNKPGRLTDEEFAIMKTHSMAGADMLDGLPFHQNEPLVKEAYKICRWHHERYDGRGYPDGLKGDEIPISAQIVALADVYDALTSKRVYKPPFSHETAVEMILGGQCGAFNPLLLECLTETSDDIRTALNNHDPQHRIRSELRNIAQEMSRYEELTASERTLQLLEHERMKYSFFAALTKDIQFEYTTSPSMLTLSNWGMERLGLDGIIMDPLHDQQVLKQINLENCAELADALRSTTPEHPDVTMDLQINCGGELRWFQMIARAIWSSDEPPRYTGAIGKAVDIHASRMKLSALEHMASHDTLTGLLNHAYAKKRILERLQNRPNASYALVIFDLDYFKQANDTYGHSFGDQVLIYVAEQLRQSIRGGDIAARAGGDEFLIFLEYRDDVESIIARIFRALCVQFGDFRISLSMGVSLTSQLSSYDYDTLFHAADQALYSVKRGGRGQYCFYRDDMKETLSAISPIEKKAAQQKEDNT